VYQIFGKTCIFIQFFCLIFLLKLHNIFNANRDITKYF